MTARTAGRGLAGRVTASWTAATGTGAAASFALAALVLVCAFIAVAVPRASLGYRTQVVQRIFRAATSPQKAVLATTDLSTDQGYLSPAELAFAGRRLAAGLRRDGLPLAPAATWLSGLATGSSRVTGTAGPSAGHIGPPELELLYRNGLAANSTVAAGSLPTRVQQHGTAATFQVAITTATAASLGLHLGSRLLTAGQTLVVTGIIRPRYAASAFWTADPVAAAPQLTYPNPNATPYLDGAAFVGPAELPALESHLSGQPLQALWSISLDLDHVNADQAAGILRATQGVGYLPVIGYLTARLSAAAGATSSPLVINVSGGLVPGLPSFVATDAAVQRALSMLFVSLAVIAAVVVLLGARLVTEHRRGEFTLMRARGAALRRVAAVAGLGGAAVVLPAAALAVGAAVLVTPGPAAWLSVWLAALIIATALAGPPLLAVRQQRARRAAAPAALARRARRRFSAARRWVADGALVCAAVGGLVILREQGLPPPGSVDLFTSLAPVLVAIPIALLVVRVYPLVLRRLARLAGRRRGVVMVVGLARGSAAAQAGLLPAFALILAFTVVAFAAMARGGVARADVTASWQAVGADAVVTAPPTGPGLTPAARRLITGVPGARRTAAIAVTLGESGQGVGIDVVVVDPQQYAALTAGTPAPPFPAAALARPGSGRSVPVLVSAAGRAMLGQGSVLYVAGRELRLHIVGSPAGMVGVPPGSQVVVVPSWALAGRVPQPTVIAITGRRLDAAALRRVTARAVPGAQVTVRAQLLAAIAGSPLPHGGFVTFAQGAAAAAAFSLLILLLMLVLSARSREVTLARLITMGLGRAQSRRIGAVENVPPILAAALGGTVCALVLVPLVGPAVNLAAFTGRPVSVPLRADPVALAIAVGGLLVLAAVTLAVQDTLARRLGPGQTLRVGE